MRTAPLLCLREPMRLEDESWTDSCVSGRERNRFCLARGGGPHAAAQQKPLDAGRPASPTCAVSRSRLAGKTRRQRGRVCGPATTRTLALACTVAVPIWVTLPGSVGAPLSRPAPARADTAARGTAGRRVGRECGALEAGPGRERGVRRRVRPGHGVWLPPERRRARPAATPALRAGPPWAARRRPGGAALRRRMRGLSPAVARVAPGMTWAGGVLRARRAAVWCVACRVPCASERSHGP